MFTIFRTIWKRWRRSAKCHDIREHARVSQIFQLSVLSCT